MSSYGQAFDPWDPNLYEDYPPPDPERWRSWEARTSGRIVSYVVLVDGKVVDTWHEDLDDSPWRDDPRLGRVSRLWRQQPPTPPAAPPWEATGRWLEHLVGGRHALDALTPEVLPDEAFVLPDSAAGDGDLVARFRRTVQVLDEVADLFFDVEMRTALRRALGLVGPELLGGAAREDPVHVAAAVCWAVARANGALSPVGRLTQKAIATQLRLNTLPTAKGRDAAHLLGRPRPPWVTRPADLADLEPLGRPELLTARTRREIMSLRDAVAEAEAKAQVRAGERAGSAGPDLTVPEAS